MRIPIAASVLAVASAKLSPGRIWLPEAASIGCVVLFNRTLSRNPRANRRAAARFALEPCFDTNQNPFNNIKLNDCKEGS
jgi:hypothetical protein